MSAGIAELLGQIGDFVELHVEQGNGLIDLDQPIAIGSRPSLATAAGA